jgi:hypothetical protein
MGEAPFRPIELRRHIRPDVLDNMAVIVRGMPLCRESLMSRGGSAGKEEELKARMQ